MSQICFFFNFVLWLPNIGHIATYDFFLWQDDFLSFIIMFMGSTSYIKNPYLRAKMVEVLNCWMPQRRFIILCTPWWSMIYNCMVLYWKFVCHLHSGLSSTASLFEGHQLCLDYLVRNLLKLYVDIEFTGSHTQVSVTISTVSINQSVNFKSCQACVIYCFYFCSFLTSLIFDIILLSFWSIYGMSPVIETHGDKWGNITGQHFICTHFFTDTYSTFSVTDS